MRKVRIAGGGLAGLSLALGLRRRGVPVTVAEAGSYPRHRVCGEFISGVTAETLERLGIADLMADVPRCSPLLWFRQGQEVLRTELPEPAICVSRHLLDDRMQRALLEAGGGLETGARTVRKAEEGLVWAAGRIPVKSDWIGLKCHVVGLEIGNELEMHLGSNGYLGLAPIEGGKVNLCGLFRLDREITGQGSERLLGYLKAGGHGALVERLRAAEIDEGSFCGVAGFQLGIQEVESELCAIGDAWGMIPPFTGNGMSMAFESAEMALDPLIAWAGGELSWTSVVSHIREAEQQRFHPRLRNAMVLQRMLLHDGGQALISLLARWGWLPFRSVLSLIR